MRFGIIRSAWWGPPRKFDIQEKDRRVSWLELFYDLVYVIAISRITYQLTLQISAGSILHFICLFILIYWGWLNGSLYHDLHGSEGLRTRLMTLWQMMIIAALAVVISQPHDEHYTGLIVVFMIMQIYITYMWWSVGFYDRSHRRFNKPYTILYLTSLALMGLSLAVPQSWLILILPLVLIFNYLPPFIAHILMRRASTDLNLSSSMVERLGLFTIIIFGELVLGVVNGIGRVQVHDFTAWLNFALAIVIVFELWWLFFTLISRRDAKSGFVIASLLELLYIPSLISLGLIAVSFSSSLELYLEFNFQKVLAFSVSTYLACITLMTGLLVIPDRFRALMRPIRVSLWVTALVFLLSTINSRSLDRTYYLIAVSLILIAEILYVNSLYYRMVAREGEQITSNK